MKEGWFAKLAARAYFFSLRDHSDVVLPPVAVADICYKLKIKTYNHVFRGQNLQSCFHSLGQLTQGRGAPLLRHRHQDVDLGKLHTEVHHQLLGQEDLPLYLRHDQVEGSHCHQER